MSTETVKVVVRKRPLNQSEIKRGNQVIIDIDRQISQVSIKNLTAGTNKPFTFDAVYDHQSTQRLLYDQTAFPLVQSVINGYNGTIFAYGQTGCGKTHTMVGDASDPEQAGIIPNSFQHIFGCIGQSQTGKTFLVRCSYSEIYNEEIRDLLNYDPKSKLELKETKDKGIFVRNLSMNLVKGIADIEQAMEYGNNHRVTKGTNMNARSSRSHAIFTIYIETSEEVEGRQIVKAGKLNLVDLAGSERQKKTGATGQTLKQAIEINLSLSALGNVISALVDGNSSHIPYRDSKLTRLLQDSLGGNTKTVMIAVVSPADYNYQESLSTLRYASRAKFIKNKPKVNQDPKDAMLRQYAQQIARLKQLLEARGPGAEPQIVQRIVQKERIVQIPRKKSTHEQHKMKLLLDQQTKNRPVIQKKISLIAEGLIQGGQNQDAILQQRLKAQREFRKRLKKQKKRQKALIEQNKKREAQILQKESNYQSLQQQVQDLRKLVERLRLQYRASLAQIDDLTHQHQMQKENILQNVRELQHECDFLNKVVGNSMNQGELEKVRRKSKFDQMNNRWKVAPFIIQTKQAMFPKIGNTQAKELVNSDIRNKTVTFTQEKKEIPVRNNSKQFLVTPQNWKSAKVLRMEKKQFLGDRFENGNKKRPLGHNPRALAPIEKLDVGGSVTKSLSPSLSTKLSFGKKKSKIKLDPLNHQPSHVLPPPSLTTVQKKLK